MSLYGILRTSTSGMAAQATRLATSAENVANVNTTGYKRASTEFSSLLLEDCPSVNYTSGSVLTEIRRGISEQGTLHNTSSNTDLAIRGNGFFIVSNPAGQPFLTRAGSFVPNADGELVNAGGFKLQGYPVTPGSSPATLNGYSGLKTVTINRANLVATPSTAGDITVNLPSNAAITPAAQLPSANTAAANYAGKSSIVSYDNLGNKVILDVYYSKTANNTWEASIYNQAQASATGGFPYSGAALTTTTLNYDGTNGKLISPTNLTLTVPNGQALTIGMANSTQLAANYIVTKANINGTPPSSMQNIEFSKEGMCYATYSNGERFPIFQIPLATVPSPDNMLQVTGNIFVPTENSGDPIISTAEQGGLGSVLSGTLEQSTVDLASELTLMIDSQRGYTANSKVFQTGAELMDVLINLKR